MTVPTTIWITGAKGFIGRHLARHLAQSGHRVVGLGHGEWPMADAVNWGLSAWVSGDIGEASLEKLFALSGPPAILFHLAGGASVAASLADPLGDFTRTVTSTAHLLDWLRRRTPACRVVAASSAAVYGGHYLDTIPETAAVSPYSPYGWHKHLMEEICRAHSANFGLKTVIVRLFSVYGPGLTKQLLWDLCCRFASDPEFVTLGGSGDERRDWIAVSDVVRLLELAATVSCEKTCTLNGGTGAATTVRDVAQQVAAAWSSEATIEFNGLARPGDPFSLVSNARHLHELGFEPTVPVNEGIATYVNWFREYRKE